MGPSSIDSPQAPSPSSSEPQPYRPVFDAFTVNGTSSKSIDAFSTKTTFSVPQQTTNAWSSNSFADEDSPSHALSTKPSSSPPLSSSATSSSTLKLASLPQTRSLEHDPNSLIYAAPNCVADEQTRRPFGSDSSNFNRLPKKAAGDVSLSGPQCVTFLMKACHRLPPVKCEGVQLRLIHLREQIEQDGLTDGFLKKLNFVVDAVDRDQYEEAWLFFDQLQQTFPAEMGTTWTQGVRLLITELRRSPNTRVGSAGGSPHLRRLH